MSGFFLVVKTVKCKRGIKWWVYYSYSWGTCIMQFWARLRKEFEAGKF